MEKIHYIWKTILVMKLIIGHYNLYFSTNYNTNTYFLHELFYHQYCFHTLIYYKLYIKISVTKHLYTLKTNIQLHITLCLSVFTD